MKLLLDFASVIILRVQKSKHCLTTQMEPKLSTINDEPTSPLSYTPRFRSAHHNKNVGSLEINLNKKGTQNPNEEKRQNPKPRRNSRLTQAEAQALGAASLARPGK